MEMDNKCTGTCSSLPLSLVHIWHNVTFFTPQVLQMARSYVERRGKEREKYMPGVGEYLSGEIDEREVKEAIKRVGGTVNASGLFLRPTSDAQVTAVTSATGMNRRSVVYIPRSRVPIDIVKAMDKC